MKKNIQIAVSLLCFALVGTSCEKRDPEFFDEGANGAYFDYATTAEYDKTVNFCDYIVDHPDTVPLKLRVKLLGYLMEEGRTLVVKTKPIEGYELADVIIDEVVFANKEYEKDIEVKVVRPEMEDVTYGVSVYLDGSGDIGLGINGKEEVKLFVTESYEKPVVWFSHMESLLGAWSREKHIYLANHVGDNHFYNRLYDESSGLHLFDSIISLNVSVVNAMLAVESTEPIVVDMPILKESDYPNYNKPYFWDTYAEYLGIFRAGKFCRFTTMLGGSNTRDIIQLYASEESKLKMEEEAVEFHKSDVHEMLNEYYRYASQGIAIAEYKSLYWVQMRSELKYSVRIPYWWEDPQGLGTAAMVKKYFGEYSADKYLFMLKTMMAKEGAEDFVAASLLPFIYDMEQGTYVWDPSPLGKNQLVGEERLKECYRIIKAEYALWEGSVNYEIPDVDLD